jgi:hypothetical protein
MPTRAATSSPLKPQRSSGGTGGSGGTGNGGIGGGEGGGVGCGGGVGSGGIGGGQGGIGGGLGGIGDDLPGPIPGPFAGFTPTESERRPTASLSLPSPTREQCRLLALVAPGTMVTTGLRYRQPLDADLPGDRYARPRCGARPTFFPAVCRSGVAIRDYHPDDPEHECVAVWSNDDPTRSSWRGRRSRRDRDGRLA